MKKLDKKQKEKLKKWLIYVIAILVGVAFLVLMFSGGNGGGNTEGGKDGFNKDLPVAEDKEHLSKERTYAEEKDKWGFEPVEEETEFGDELFAPKEEMTPTIVPSKNSKNTISIFSQEDIENDRKEANKLLEDMLAKEKEEEERKRKKEEDEERKAEEEQQRQVAKIDSITKMAQEQVKLAMQMLNPTVQSPTDNQKSDEDRPNATVAMPVKRQGNNMVSTLKRGGFYGTESSGDGAVERTSIRARIYGEHIIRSGQNVRMKIDEPLQVGNFIIRRGSLIVGTATIGVDRVLINVQSIEQNGVVVPVAMHVYDTDGMLGLFVPGSMENEAVKEVAGEITQSVGNSASQQASSYINNQSAVEQIKADALRGTLAGVTKYATRKLQETKVTLPDGHKVLLMSTLSNPASVK